MYFLEKCVIIYSTSSIGDWRQYKINVVHITETGLETTIACDLGVYPFGFILNLTPETSVEYGTSIMNFFDTKYNNRYSTTLNLMYLERTDPVLPMPLVFKPLPDNAVENN